MNLDMQKIVKYNVRRKGYYMNPKIVISILAMAVVCGAVAFSLHALSHYHVRHTCAEQVHNTCGGRDRPITLSPAFRFNMGPGQMLAEKVQLNTAQRDKVKRLDKNLKNDIEKLHAKEDELRTQYRAKIDAILDADQRIKIEALRDELRNDMQKLHEKRQEIVEKHKKDFDAILTEAQKKELEKTFEANRKSHGQQ